MRFNNILLTGLFILSSYAAFAQNDNVLTKEMVDDAAKRTTIFILKTEDTKVIAKLKKTPSEIEVYKADIAAFNDRLKAAVERWWKFTEKYEYHTLAETNKLIKGKANKNYLLFQYLQHTEKIPGALPPSTQIVATTLPYKKVSTPTNYGYYELRAAENIIPTKPALIEIPLATLAPKLIDNVFSIQLMQYNLYNVSENLKESDIKKNYMANAKVLLSKNLLIDLADIDEDGLSETKIKKAYQFEYSVLESDSSVNRIFEGNADYAYVRIIPSPNDGKLYHYVVSCEDGTFCNLYISKFDAKAKRKERITIDALKGYCKNIK
jgi:hypothetical protein